MNVNIFIAFAAGIVSFLSPCIFPVIPSYLSYIGGLSLAEAEKSRKGRSVLFLNSLFFVIGFTAVFTILGVFFSGVGMALSGVNRYINIAAGSVVILLGLNFVFDFWKVLNLEKRFHFSKRPNGLAGSVLLGMAFGAGWTPCIGPILASILFMASGSGAVERGAVLLLVYSFGLGLPFIIAGVFIAGFRNITAAINRHLHGIKIGSGIFLVLIGVLILTGQLNRINIYLFQLAGLIGQFSSEHPAALQIIAGLVFLGFAVLFFRSFWNGLRRRQAAAEDASETGTNSGVQIPRYPAVRLGFTILMAVAALLAFTGVLDPGAFLISWLTFQGL